MTACAMIAPALQGPPAGVATRTTTMSLHGSPFDLHFAQPLAAPPRTLVVYASGDGGWYGTAIEMFRTIAAAGYPVVGFSSRAFLRLERPSHAALNPRQLAADYDAIVSRTRAAFSLAPDAPVILTGWSRGAGFAALAGTEAGLPHVRGIVAIGLSDGEDLRMDDDASDDGADAGGPRRVWPYAPYARLRATPMLRSAVVQATGDVYLPAAKARPLLDPDDTVRRFYEVPARNHRFAGAHDAFTTALVDALAWVDQPAIPTE